MAAGATYEPIATTTLASAASSITFSSISSAYTDIVAIITYTSSSFVQVRVRCNSDTATNYSATTLAGDGTSATTGRNSNVSTIDGSTGNGSSTIPAFYKINFFGYAGSTYKTVLFESSGDANGSGEVRRTVGLWRSTSAINSITLLTGNLNTYAAGTTATLYGIAAA